MSKDGGPAFASKTSVRYVTDYSVFEGMPHGGSVMGPLPKRQIVETTGGMSMRDYFAAAFLTGMAGRESYDPGQASPTQRAALAYIEADAMLAEREKERK